MGHHTKPKSSSSTSSFQEKYQASPLSHITNLSLTFISTLFLLLVILYNVPFSSTQIGDLGGRLWLITLKSKGREYGFGIWGFCTWSNSLDGVCKKKAFWNLPRDDEMGGLRGLDLPSEISKSLSISGFFLLFVSYISLTILLFLILTLQFHSYDQPPINHQIYWLQPKKMRFRTWLAFNLRNMYLRSFSMIVITAWGLPVLLISAIGKRKLENQNKKGMGDVKVELGKGWALAISAVIALMLVQLIIPLAGLWNNAKRSGKKHG